MDLRHALHELAARYQLSTEASARLIALGEQPGEPFGIQRKLPVGLAILGAALGGMGIIFFVAANWETFDRTARFALLQIVVAVMCVGALTRPPSRAPLSIVAFFAIGGLFAYFGQTYQTGADPWQLFAIWAGLTVPLCLGVRHDALWALWVLVAMSAVSLWIGACTGQIWRVSPTDLMIHMSAWSAALMLTFALGPLMTKVTGAGIWALRTSLTLTVIIITSAALMALFERDVAPQYWLGLFMLCAAGAPFITRHPRDSFALSVVSLGMNVLLAGGLGCLLLSAKSADIGLLLLWGIGAAGLLAATVTLILHLTRQDSGEGVAA